MTTYMTDDDDEGDALDIDESEIAAALNVDLAAVGDIEDEESPLPVVDEEE